MRILESVLYAEDLVAAREFYVGLLGLEEVSFDADRDLFLRVGDGMLILFKASRTVIHDSGVPPHGTTGAGHLAFAATPEEIEIWRARLEENGVEIIQSIDWKNGAKSIYFRDPAGNVLEFATPSLWGLA
ncbi:MAG: VOC family protein [Armatimonadetes bacterium]|nr:VOC family protein [Armatimonadota bacterium]